MSKILSTIYQAAYAHKTLIIEYQPKDSFIYEQREIEPFSFRPEGTTERLMAWDTEKQGVRSFLTDNIRSARKTSSFSMAKMFTLFQRHFLKSNDLSVIAFYPSRSRLSRCASMNRSFARKSGNWKKILGSSVTRIVRSPACSTASMSDCVCT